MLPAMAALPVEVLLGIYLGLLTGIIPALVAWAMGFLFKYFTGVTVPALAVVVLGVAIAGVNGGLLALVDPTISTLPNSERVVVAILVVMMMSLYAHSQGDRLGAAFPRRLSLRKLRQRTISADVVELVGGHGHVRVTVAGEVGDVEGYPPLSSEVRSAIRGGEWSFPADIPLAEIERRLEDRLRTAHDLAEVVVRVDERGRASVSAAPAASGVSTRVLPGRRAVSVEALVPTGLARGDEVTLVSDDATVSGTLVSARSDGGDPSGARRASSGQPSGGGGSAEPARAEEEGLAGEGAAPTPPPRAATTDGGDGRVTVAVPPADAERLLRAERAHVVVASRGVRGEFELLSVLQRAGTRLRKLVVGDEGPLSGSTLAGAAVRDEYGVAVLALRGDDGWVVAPAGDAALAPGAQVFAVGAREGLDRFAEAIA